MFHGVFAGKRVLVTGHTGFKGSWLTQWLLDLGAEVGGYSNTIYSAPNHFEALKLAEHMQCFMGDVCDFESLHAVFVEFKPEVVFHLAAQAIVFEAYEQPRETFLTNIQGTANILDCIRLTDSVEAAVMITSDKCYENVEWEYGYRENDRLGGKDPYSASKAGAEIVFSAYARSYFSEPQSTRLASARAGNVIGGGDWAKYRIVPDCVRAWSQGTEPIIRSPRATRPWQHVLEPLSGYLRLAEALLSGEEDIANESFNFAPSSDAVHTVADLLEEFKKTWNGCSWKIVEADSNKKEATLLSLNCDKSFSRLSWRTTLDFEQTIRFTSEWYQEFAQNPDHAQRITEGQIRDYSSLARHHGMSWAKDIERLEKRA